MSYLDTEIGSKLLAGYLKQFEGKSSQKVYKSEIRQFFKWYGGPLVGLTGVELKRYGKHLSETATARTIKRKFSILNRFLKYAEKRDKGFSSPIGKAHGDVQALQSSSYSESETFARNMDHWHELLKVSSTAKTYTGNVRCFFQWARKAPGDLSQEDFIRYRDHLVNERGLKPSTVWNKFISINRFLSFLSEKSRNYKNPLDFARLNLTRAPKDSGYQNVLTVKEIEKLTKAPDRRTLIGKRDYAILMLMLLYGPRAGEVCGIRWRDIEPERIDGQQKIWIRNRKGRAGNRKDTAYILNGKLLQAWDGWLENCGVRFEPDTPVFLGFIWDVRTRGLEISRRQVRDKKPLTVATVENIVGKYLDKAGITAGNRVLSPHALRHTALTEMSNAGVPVATVKYIAGHQDVNTTMIYTHHRQDYADNIGLSSRLNR